MDSGDGRSQQPLIAEGIGAVDELIDGASRRQPADLVVGDRLAQRRDEAPGADHLVGPVEVRPHRAVQRCGEPEFVVQRGDRFEGDAQVLLPLGPGSRRDSAEQRRPQAGGHPGQEGERGAEPLAVRRIGPVHEQGQPGQVPAEPGGDDRGAKVIARLRAPAGKRLLWPILAHWQASTYRHTSSGYQRRAARAAPSPASRPRHDPPAEPDSAASPSLNTAPLVSSARTCVGVASQSSSPTPARGSKPSRSVSQEPISATSTQCRGAGSCAVTSLNLVGQPAKVAGRRSASIAVMPAARCASWAPRKIWHLGPQLWSLDRGESKPSTSDPGPISAAECRSPAACRSSSGRTTSR